MNGALRLSKQLHDPAFHRKNARLLFLGIAFIVCGVAFEAYSTIVVLPKVKTSYAGIRTRAEAFTPNTDNERLYRSISIEMAKQAQEGWSKAMSSLSGEVALSFVLLGAVLVNTYTMKRQFKSLMTEKAPNPYKAL